MAQIWIQSLPDNSSSRIASIFRGFAVCIVIALITGAHNGSSLVSADVVDEVTSEDEISTREIPMKITKVLSPSEISEFIPEAQAYGNADEMAVTCAEMGFMSASGGSERNFETLESFRELAENFYNSGSAKLANDEIVSAILRGKKVVAASCPLAVQQAMLMRTERLLLEVYMSNSQSRDLHAKLFNEASQLNIQFNALADWTAASLGGKANVPDLGWPLDKGWARVQRYYKLLWTDVHNSEDTWAMMEEPGAITDGQYHDAIADVVKVFGDLGLEWWPCRGTLIAFLRHGRRAGYLSRGMIDVVERDIDVMMGVEDETQWQLLGKTIEQRLKQLGWDKCWTKSSADGQSQFYGTTRRDLLYCIRTKPVYILLDVTSYISAAHRPNEENLPYVFVHRVCGAQAQNIPDGASGQDGCVVPPNVGPLRHGRGTLSKDAIHPMGICRADTLSVPCPRQPLETILAMIHSGLSAGCIALPTAVGREADDPMTHRLASEGLTADDVRILRNRSARLNAMGFMSMTPYFEAPGCADLEEILVKRDVAPGY
eukprot:TRINITY_DN34975_c0_g1_i1.p1 TRINITY_DN34975_c0_g1~~TRINITY_DN34975_c0_g1_i1.p1  ORF type:complete len:545 (-),score=85.94 TRINITY_DN34975_c0_g1_i1:649-2283(-)